MSNINSTGSALTILVADDEDRIRKLVGDFLSRKGYEIIEAADGGEALRIGEIREKINRDASPKSKGYIGSDTLLGWLTANTYLENYDGHYIATEKGLEAGIFPQETEKGSMILFYSPNIQQIIYDHEQDIRDYYEEYGDKREPFFISPEKKSLLRSGDDTTKIIEPKKSRDHTENMINYFGNDIIKRAEEQGKEIIVLAGRPYHVDPEINHGIDKLITSFDVAIVSEDIVSNKVKKKVKTSVLNQWTYHSRMYAAAEYVSHHSNMNLVQLVSFGCGVDAITTDEVRAILERHGRIYTQIKIDEITNLGAVKIRLRSLLATTKREKKKNK